MAGVTLNVSQGGGIDEAIHSCVEPWFELQCQARRLFHRPWSQAANIEGKNRGKGIGIWLHSKNRLWEQRHVDGEPSFILPRSAQLVGNPVYR
ncbi:MAG TPA: hypothetical protein VGD78_08160 [Chthoniobacterales bacterium]